MSKKMSKRRLKLQYVFNSHIYLKNLHITNTPYPIKIVRESIITVWNKISLTLKHTNSGLFPSTCYWTMQSTYTTLISRVGRCLHSSPTVDVKEMAITSQQKDDANEDTHAYHIVYFLQ